MYANLTNIRRMLNPRPSGTLSGCIFIGTSGSAHASVAFGSQCMNEAGSFIDGMLYHRYKTPLTSTPGDIKWIANRLAISYIIFAVKRHVADSASNFLYDKQQAEYGMAMTKLQALADGVENLYGYEIAGAPQGEFTKSDDKEFAVPGSGNVRPAVGL